MTRIFDPNRDTLDYEFDYNPVETTQLKLADYGNVTLSDLRRVALWKCDRVLEIPDDIVSALRSLAAMESLNIDSDESRRILERLVACGGVGYPMASAFLKFIRPTIFPIIDVRAYRALTGKRVRYDQYNTSMYVEYAKRLQSIAAKTELPLSEIDEQLYCFDRVHNGSISD